MFPLEAMYNTVFWDFRSCQQALRGQNVSPQCSTKDTTTKVDKMLLTSEMYRKVNELKAENWRVLKKN